MKFTLSLGFLATLVGVIIASPVELEARKDFACTYIPSLCFTVLSAYTKLEYSGANDAGDMCPEGWTCCGPILPEVGGKYVGHHLRTLVLG
jgi:hypothetical protein